MESNVNFNFDREQIHQLITAYRSLPILWNPKCPNYSKKDKRFEAYEKLLHVYRKIKYNATIIDLKKKINSMRSNFRKEIKKVEESAAIGVKYKPSSWMYDSLIFLIDSENSDPSENSLPSEAISLNVAVSDENDSGNDNDASHGGESDVPPIYQHQHSVKKLRYSELNDNDVPHTSYIQYSGKRPAKHSSDSSQFDASPHSEIVPIISYNDDLAKVWAAKLKHLAALQRLFAEKAINDVLFEAQLGTLHRNSVKINIGHSTNTISNEPIQPSPEYKFSQTVEFNPDD